MQAPKLVAERAGWDLERLAFEMLELQDLLAAEDLAIEILGFDVVAIQEITFEDRAGPGSAGPSRHEPHSGGGQRAQEPARRTMAAPPALGWAQAAPAASQGDVPDARLTQAKRFEPATILIEDAGVGTARVAEQLSAGFCGRRAEARPGAVRIKPRWSRSRFRRRPCATRAWLHVRIWGGRPARRSPILSKYDSFRADRSSREETVSG